MITKEQLDVIVEILIFFVIPIGITMMLIIALADGEKNE